MTARRLSDLLARAEVRPLAPVGTDPEVTGLSADSRRVIPGDVFFALRGERADGVSFAGDAVTRGARAIVSERERPRAGDEVAWVRVDEPRRVMALLAREWFGRPDTKLTLVGVTGTNGKTTVTFLVEAIARAAGRRPGRIGTNGVAFGGQEIPADRTTPDALELYGLLSRMHAAGTDLVAMEVSSHALALQRVAGARFEVAVFLNLGRDHLDFHGTLDAYFEAKAALFDRLDPRGVAVLPADDPRGEELARRTRARVVRFGRRAGADVRLHSERFDLAGSRATLDLPSGPIPVATPLLGRFNLENVAAAAACAVAVDLPVGAIAEGIASLRGVPGRLERVDAGQPFAVLVDYAHTEAALASALRTVREAAPGRVAVVFGCGGDRDPGKRRGMGRVAAEIVDAAWMTSDNPRGEDPLAILDAVRAGFDETPGAADRGRVEPDRARAIADAIAWARAGDAVVIAGKGHETTQTFADRVEIFDDGAQATHALAALGWAAA